MLFKLAKEYVNFGFKIASMELLAKWTQLKVRTVTSWRLMRFEIMMLKLRFDYHVRTQLL